LTESLFQHGRPIGIAHRGSRLLWPENTMTAFAGAAQLGYGYFETDLRATADGELVCFHDPDLERTTDGRGPVAAATWETVSSLDAGFNHRIDQGYPFRGRQVSVPRLIDLAVAFPDSGLVIDLKADESVMPLAELVTELGWQDRAIVGSFSEARLARFRQLTSDRVPTSASPNQTLRAVLSGAVGGILRGDVLVLAVPASWYGIPVVTDRFIRAAHSAGKLVHVWTVNRTAEMRLLLDMGVDGIITDRPDLLAPLITQGGR
jgi:glycerophosphoryl diester phosphodiesterase